MAERAEAGRRGESVRSDAWVGVELGGSGGIRIECTSKVASMYGAAIEQEAREVLAALGVTDARVSIDDQGALGYVLSARVEAAVRRARPELAAREVPPLAPHAQRGTTRDRFRRSRLYLPGNEPKFALSAGLHGADALILDLEDSVAPAEKDTARLLVRNTLFALDLGGAERMVRINGGELGLLDLEAVVPANVHVVLVPKCESGDQLRSVAARAVEIAERVGVGPPFLLPIIESARGALAAFEIASSHERVVGVAIGLEDYTADIGAERTEGGEESAWARAQVVNGARAAGVQAFDSVYSDVGNEDGLRRAALRSRALGFDGMGCIHPRQIRVVHDAFAPEPETLARATAIVRAFEAAEADGLGVVALENKMIDPPVVKRAHHTVALAIASGRLAEDWRERDGDGSGV